MNVKGIVIKWLQDNGYDGLCEDGCGCGVDDLMPCDPYCGGCVPAHLASDEEIVDNGEDPEEMRGHYWVSGKKTEGQGNG